MPKILVVEDLELNLELIKRILDMHGFEHDHAEDGQQAVEKALITKPDLILMDMGLPIMDGWTATRKIKETQEVAHIPIIALTAHSMKDDIKKAMDAGCCDYISKPITDLDEIATKIKHHLKLPPT